MLTQVSSHRCDNLLLLKNLSYFILIYTSLFTQRFKYLRYREVIPQVFVFIIERFSGDIWNGSNDLCVFSLHVYIVKLVCDFSNSMCNNWSMWVSKLFWVFICICISFHHLVKDTQKFTILNVIALGTDKIAQWDVSCCKSCAIQTIFSSMRQVLHLHPNSYI